MKGNILFITSLLISSVVYSQLSFDGEFRPRSMYNHGYIKPLSTGQNPGFFVSQRTRLNFGFVKEKMEFGISLQDVRVWGDENQTMDTPSIGLFNSWAALKMSSKWKVKIGRQALVYDDSRLFSSLNWAQQGRAHDAAVFKYKNDSLGYTIDLGLAYNQDGGSPIKQAYTGNYYTNMEYVYIKKDREKITYSLLAINDGYTASSSSDVRQRYTLGGNIWLKMKKLKLKATGYYQTGESTTNSISGSSTEGKKINAYMFALKTMYPIGDKAKLVLAYDHLSGASSESLSDPNIDEITTFNPLFGLHHAFYGHMDNFYVGFIPTTGLSDISLGYSRRVSKKVEFNMGIHAFSTQSKLWDENMKNMPSNLGNEIDLNAKIKLDKTSTFIVGYSHFLTTDTMIQLKGGTEGKTSNWGWMMLVLKPKFL